MNKAIQILVALCCIFPLSVSAQKVDTMNLAGEDVFVYPFKMEVTRSYKYWRIVVGDRDKVEYSYDEYLAAVQRNNMVPDSMILTQDEFARAIKLQKIRSYKKLKRNFFPKLGELPTEEQFKSYLKRKKRKRKNRSDEDRYLYDKKLKKAVLANPYPMLLQEVKENNDLIPVLDPIPDGKYVQLYEAYCIYDEKGKCNSIEDGIAGYFTIKDNKLEGEATWIDLKGDTIKHGHFKGGLKEGEWMYLNSELSGRLDEFNAIVYVETGSPMIDSSYRIIEYKNGAKEGRYRKYESSKYPISEGNYIAGKKSGEWTFRPKQTMFHSSDTMADYRDNKLVETHYVLNDNDSLIVKPIWVREKLMSTWNHDEDEFNFYGEYNLISIPNGLYSVAFEKEESLDLDEEAEIREYEYLEDIEYSLEGYSEELNYMDNSVFDRLNNNVIKKGKAIDSLGAIPKYTEVYEAFYPNGQLAYKYEFPDGLMKEEPNIYWDNGQVHDQVTFDADSNHYQRQVFDYDGKLYRTIYYDSVGDFKSEPKEEVQIDSIEIDGIKVRDNDYGKYWHYNAYDTLNNENLTEKVLIYKTWSQIDSMVLWDGFYDPKTRIRDGKIYALDGSTITSYYGEFSAGFDSWTGKVNDYFGNLELVTTRSASFSEYAEADSIPQNHVGYMYDWFDITRDYVLEKDGEPYSGDLVLDFTMKKIAIEKDMTIYLPIHNPMSEVKVEKAFTDYKEKGKTKQALAFSQLNSVNYTDNVGVAVFDNMFSGLLGDYFEVKTVDRYSYTWNSDDGEEEEVKLKKKEIPSHVVKIEGKLLDGKPQGTWVSYDQFGNIRTEVPFDKGEANGQMKVYAYQEAGERNGYSRTRRQFRDSVPQEQVYYLAHTTDFVNGARDGEEISYNWLGEIQNKDEFKEGYKSGVSVSRNKLATSISNYERGNLDGYLKTYLTLPGKDSILVYDLNFQEGSLQGESKSYHANGNISKKGFFLAGQPIDDYEGYDSLGFKYHYVKFKYSFPVEEKIWEENELSVRYLFDWQDSIQFNPMDITNSESIESLLYDFGFDDNLYEPFYGRPSIVKKSGVNYQLTKYYPNDTIARDGKIKKGKKAGCWEYFSYDGDKLYEANYFDSLIVVNDSIKFSSKGVYTGFNADGEAIYESYIIEKSERYDCSHSDHYEVRQLKTIWQADDSLNRMNGHVYNYYDNGSLQSDGEMKDGLPTGEWRFYDPNGKLNKYGVYVLGKRNGRWLSGDLSKTKYLGDICLNPNLPDIEGEIKYRENLLDIEIVNYKLGKVLNTQFYDVDMNQFIEKEETEEN